MKLASARRDAELELLSSVLCSHQALTAVASKVGVRRHHFGSDDARLIYLAAVNTRQYPKITMLRLARAALDLNHFWDPSQIGGNLGSMRWSDESLARLATMSPPLEQYVEHLANRLIRLDRRERGAHHHHRRCLDLLEGRQITEHAQPSPEMAVAA